MSKYFVDLAERVAATAAFTFLSVFTVSDLSTTRDAGVAAAAAALTLVKGALAGFLSGGNQAGLTSSK